MEGTFGVDAGHGAVGTGFSHPACDFLRAQNPWREIIKATAIRITATGSSGQMGLIRETMARTKSIKSRSTLSCDLL